MLLERSAATPIEALTQLVGLQAQTPHTWYAGLWTRLRDVTAPEISRLLEERRIVRIALMRSTIHLVTADDALDLRPLLDIVGERSFQNNFAKRLAGVDFDDVAQAGRAIVEATPCTFSELGRELAKRWPGRDEAALAQVIRARVPLVQVTPRGLWGRSGKSAHTSVEAWLGSSTRAYPVERMVQRYLGAFGPASVKDAQTWSGLTRLGEVFDRLRPSLVTFRDPAGVEVFDLPDAPRPGPDAPAPVRFLYDFDNLLLSHADRSRVITDAYLAVAPGYVKANVMPRLFLVDGFTAGTWTLAVTKSSATLAIAPFAKLPARTRTALAAEGASLLDFHAPGIKHDMAFA